MLRHMAFAHFGFQKWRRILLEVYVSHADAQPLYELIAFYTTYRAIVRLKVSCLRLAGTAMIEQPKIKKDIALYLEQAYL